MVKKFLKVAVACAFGAQSLAGVGAFAQTAPGSQNCTCVSSSQAAGIVTSAKGNVLVSQVDGMRPAVAGSALTSQSRIVVGSAGAATIGLGGCNLSIAGNSQATVTRIGDQLCVKVESLVITPVHEAGTAAASAGGGASTLPMIAGIVALGGAAGLAIALSDDKNQNNAPVTP